MTHVAEAVVVDVAGFDVVEAGIAGGIICDEGERAVCLREQGDL